MPSKPLKPYSRRWIDTEPESAVVLRRWPAFSLAAAEGLCSPALAREDWTAWAAGLPGLLESGTAEPIRHEFIPTSGRQTFLATGPAGQAVVVKRYTTAAGAERPATGRTGGDFAWGAFCRQVVLHHLGQPVPEPLLFLTSQPGLPAQRWCSVSALLEDCVPLLDFAFEHLHRRASRPGPVRIWMQDVVRAVASLHRAGYAHGDLHQQNILIRHHAEGEHLEVFWTDFDACERTAGPWPAPAHLADLAMLAASLDGLAPPALLRRGLGHYFALGNLALSLRRRSREAIGRAYGHFLAEFRQGFALVEQHCLAEVERRLASAPRAV